MATRQIEKGVAYTATFYPPEGVPTSATLQIVAPSGTNILAATSATIDSLSATVASASRGDTTFAVNSGSGISVGQRAWLATAGGRGYELTVVDASGTTVTPDEPVRFNISSGTFKGLRISYSMTTTHTGTAYRNVRLVWRYTAGGVVRAHTDVIDIVLWPFELPLTEADLEAVDPTWGDMSSDYSGLFSQAQADIDSWLRGKGYYPDLVRDRRVLVPAAVYRVLQLRHMRTSQDLWESYGTMYREALSELQSSTAWYDADDDLKTDTDTDDGMATEMMPASYCKVG